MHVWRSTAALTAAALAALAATGCGSSGSGSQSSAAGTTATTQASTGTTATTTSAPARPEKEPKMDIALKGPRKLEPISARYTCDGANVAPTLTWRHVPANAAELDLFIFNAFPIKGKLVSEWGVAGLQPSLHSISEGRLPAGAILARNSSGGTRYSLCPPKGSPLIHYAVLLYAPSYRTKVKPGFDPEALVEKNLEPRAESEGRIYFSYKRR